MQKLIVGNFVFTMDGETKAETRESLGLGERPQHVVLCVDVGCILDNGSADMIAAMNGVEPHAIVIGNAYRWDTENRGVQCKHDLSSSTRAAIEYTRRRWGTPVVAVEVAKGVWV